MIQSNPRSKFELRFQIKRGYKKKKKKKNVRKLQETEREDPESGEGKREEIHEIF